MKSRTGPRTIRRSVAISSALAREAASLAPPELRDNFNRLVVVAIEEFAARRKARAFEDSMTRMAADPAIQTESRAILGEFSAAEMDGLKS